MGIARRMLAGLFFASMLTAAAIAGARADTQTLTTGPDPVVVTMIQGDGSITVRTWDRQEVGVDADPSIAVVHNPRVSVHQLPPALLTFFAATVQTPSGPLTLPPEPFVPPPFDLYGHDVVRLTGSTGNVTLHVPAGTPFLFARVRQGALTIDGFHGGTFVAQVGAGQIHLNNDGGTAAVQANFGPIVTTNSSFDRLRMRTARGPMFFDNCTARQIEATSLMGSIIYDNGSFEPGLARFETETGNIALGVRGGAQIAAHSEGGTVNSEGSLAGGPTVTATSRSGNIVYYNGSLREHPNLAKQIAPKAANRIEHIEKTAPVQRRPPAPSKTTRPTRRIKCCAHGA